MFDLPPPHSSRHALRIRSEHTFRVYFLFFPPPRAGMCDVCTYYSGLLNEIQFERRSSRYSVHLNAERSLNFERER